MKTFQDFLSESVMRDPKSDLFQYFTMFDDIHATKVQKMESLLKRKNALSSAISNYESKNGGLDQKVEARYKNEIQSIIKELGKI